MIPALLLLLRVPLQHCVRWTATCCKLLLLLAVKHAAGLEGLSDLSGSDPKAPARMLRTSVHIIVRSTCIFFKQKQNTAELIGFGLHHPQY